MSNKQESIPKTNLYEEPEGLQAPERLYIESIIDRSRFHKFKIKAHRHHGLHQIFFLTQGEGQATLDGHKVILKAPCLLIVSEMSVHDFDWQPSIDGFILSVSTSLSQSLISNLGALSTLFLQSSIYNLQQNVSNLKRLFEQLFDEFQQFSVGRNQALESLCKLILIELLRVEESSVHASVDNDPKVVRLHQFTQLIEQHYQEQQPVSFYAKKLNITPTHLNVLCRELTERSALMLIHERLLLEIKRSLLYSGASISEISWSMSFSEPAYFSRFFKRMTGVSPKVFRDKVG